MQCLKKESDFHTPAGKNASKSVSSPYSDNLCKTLGSIFVISFSIDSFEVSRLFAVCVWVKEWMLLSS